MAKSRATRTTTQALPSHLRDLTHDPKQARVRTERGAGLIEQSFREVGAARSIVIDETGRVLAGNGSVDGAAAAGIEKVRVVVSNGDELIAVMRPGLSEEQKVRLALLDNRTAELAGWDMGVIRELAAQNVAINDLFTADELTTMMRELAASARVSAEDERDPTRSRLGAMAYKIVVDCEGEAHQGELLARFEGEGLKVKALIVPA